jgi:hypothetical protein
VQVDVYKASLSAQLVQVLEESEERINRRMREVVRQQPTNRSLVSVSLSPNKSAIYSARSQKHHEAETGRDGALSLPPA